MLKSKKRVITIMSILSALFLLLVIGSALFSLQKVSVEFMNTGSHIEGYNKNAIVEAGGFSYGKNVLFMNFDKNVKKIEAAFPYAKVVGVTRYFPNKAVVRVVEREAQFRITVAGTTLVFDSDLKCLEKFEYGSEPSLPKFINMETYSNVEPGSFVANPTLKNIIIGVSSGIDNGSASMSMSSVFSINRTTDILGEDQVEIVLYDGNNLGTTIVIKGLNNFTQKAIGAFNCYSSSEGIQNSLNKGDITITVPSNFDGTGGITVTGLGPSGD